MSYRYPQYPSEEQYTPQTWNPRWQGQQSGYKQKLKISHVTVSKEMNPGTINHMRKYENMDTHETDIYPESYEEVLEKTLYKETCSNIRAMIHSNNQAIEKLQQNNLMLRQHLYNLKQIFKSKQVEQKQRIPEQTFQSETYQPQYTQNFENFNEHKRVVHEQKIQREEQEVKIQSQGTRRIYLPSKGPVRYTKESWVKEQFHVQEFIQTFLKDNIKVTPSQPFNIIEKRKILQLYLKWSGLKNLEKSQLKPFKIQQIITNEMKVVFGCSITMKDYVGLIFKDIHEQKETKDPKSKEKPQQGQIQKTKAKDRKKFDPNAIWSEGQEKLDEEFSIGSSNGEFKIEEHSNFYP